MGGETAFNLTEGSLEDDGEPAFSPDGMLIAFDSNRDDRGIFLMGATGESVRRLTDFGFNPAWSPDGKHIVFSTVLAESSTRHMESLGQLRTIDIDTGEIRTIEIDGDAVQPHWSPHGHRIAFWSINLSEQYQRDIWTIPADGGKPVPVTNDDHIDWNPVWSPNGRYIYFSSNRGGTMSLWRVAVEEETGIVIESPELVTTSVAARIGQITISGDGRRIAYRADVGTSNIQKISFDPDSGAVVGEPVWITQGSRITAYPDPSPDGEWLAFNFKPGGGGQADIAIIRTDGTGLRQLTNAPHHGNFLPHWSPDGSRIAFYSGRSGNEKDETRYKSHVWTIKPDGSGLKQLTETPYGVSHLAWSPDGSRMVYFEDIGSFSSYIFSPALPWDEQKPQKLPPLDGEGENFTANSWSPDGQWLAGYVFMHSLASHITLFSIHSQEYQMLPVEGKYPVWLSDSRRLLYSYQGRIYLLDSESGSTHEVLSVAPDYADWPRLSGDDRWIYFRRIAEEADIWMLTLDE